MARVANAKAGRLDDAWGAVAKRAAEDPPWLRDLLVPLVAAARRTPELAELFPFTSMNRLCFSRCSDYPFTLDCPCVAIGRGGYLVQPTWAVSEVEDPPLHEATADDLASVMRVVVEHLPSDRSTWLGTRDDAR
jgi:hypothetical protein